MKQLNLFANNVRLEFGGTLGRGRRKCERPLVFRKPIHFVLKAQNSWLLLRHQKEIGEVLESMSARFGVKIYSLAVNADHIHLVIKLHSRELYRRWIRAVTSLLVRRVVGLRFRLRPYSRIVSWGRQFRSVLAYLKCNRQEAEFVLWAWKEAWGRPGLKFGVPPV